MGFPPIAALPDRIASAVWLCVCPCEGRRKAKGYTPDLSDLRAGREEMPRTFRPGKSQSSQSGAIQGDYHNDRMV